MTDQEIQQLRQEVVSRRVIVSLSPELLVMLLASKKWFRFQIEGLPQDGKATVLGITSH
jgi:hypothetical protein